jgi:hypothetical protein
MVMRDERRVPVDHRPPSLEMPLDVVEVRELVRWVLQRCVDESGFGS